MTLKTSLLLTATVAALALAGCARSATTGNAADNDAAIDTNHAAALAPLKLAGSVDFPGYTGDFDHFAIDTRDNKVFVAGEEFHEVEVLDRTTGALIKRISGYGAPHSLLYMPDTIEMLVIDGEKPSQVLDAATLQVKRTYKLPAGADSVAYDAQSKHLWVVTGGKDVPQKDSNLIEIDPATGKIFRSVHFDADHVEALAIEQNGSRIFINVTDKNYLAVIDKNTGKVTAQWHIKEAEQNAPIAYDEGTHRLFVVTRKPGKLVILNADTGATIAEFKAPERTDQVVWDAANRRVYVAGGEGYTLVVEQDSADEYRDAAHITTLPGAKTAIVDAERNRLWIAASPGESKAMGKILWVDIVPR
jgi:DNA-binding beta-propeller fold protein YncE